MRRRRRAAGSPSALWIFVCSYHVGVAALDVVLTIANSARGPVQFELAWDLAADFADIQEAQSGRARAGRYRRCRGARRPRRVRLWPSAAAVSHGSPPRRALAAAGRACLTHLTLQPRQTEDSAFG